MIDLQNLRQTTDWDCGAKVLQTVMAYYGVDTRESRVLRELQTTRMGTRPANMRRVAQKYGFKVRSGTGWTLEDIKRYVNLSIPVIVLLQAWAERPMTLEDWARDYDDGHYAVVIDIKNEIVVFEDPSSFPHTWLTESEFLARWHDRDPRTRRKVNHFGMVLLGKDPVPHAAKHMD
jgi:predicted double-glycine peptidase